MPPCRDFEPEMCTKTPMRYASPDGGSDPIALEQTDEPVHTQCIHNPIWSRLTHGAGTAGQYDPLPNQNVAKYPEFSDRKI